MFGMFFVVALLVVIAAVIIIVATQNRSGGSGFILPFHEKDEKDAGDEGERIATGVISRALRDGDYLFTNVSVEYDGKPAEMDNVVVNKYGVFIIEVKNYKGRLYGEEDDFEWNKFKDDGYGNTFEKTVKNPLRQVKRQTYVFANFLRDYGVDVWVEGYAYFVNGNSAVDSEKLLESPEDIDRAIHTFAKRGLSRETVEEIRNLLSEFEN